MKRTDDSRTADQRWSDFAEELFKQPVFVPHKDKCSYRQIRDMFNKFKKDIAKQMKWTDGAGGFTANLSGEEGDLTDTYKYCKSICKDLQEIALSGQVAKTEKQRVKNKLDSMETTVVGSAMDYQPATKRRAYGSASSDGGSSNGGRGNSIDAQMTEKSCNGNVKP